MVLITLNHAFGERDSHGGLTAQHSWQNILSEDKYLTLVTERGTNDDFQISYTRKNSRRKKLFSENCGSIYSPNKYTLAHDQCYKLTVASNPLPIGTT